MHALQAHSYCCKILSMFYFLSSGRTILIAFAARPLDIGGAARIEDNYDFSSAAPQGLCVFDIDQTLTASESCKLNGQAVASLASQAHQVVKHCKDKQFALAVITARNVSEVTSQLGFYRNDAELLFTGTNLDVGKDGSFAMDCASNGDNDVMATNHYCFVSSQNKGASMDKIMCQFARDFHTKPRTVLFWDDLAENRQKVCTYPYTCTEKGLPIVAMRPSESEDTVQCGLSGSDPFKHDNACLIAHAESDSLATAAKDTSVMQNSPKNKESGVDDITAQGHSTVEKLNEMFFRGHASENLAEVGVLTKIFSINYHFHTATSTSQEYHYHENQLLGKLHKANFWKDVITDDDREVMSVSINNIKIVHNGSLNVYDHGYCGMILNNSAINDKWRCFYPFDAATEYRSENGCGSATNFSRKGWPLNSKYATLVRPEAWKACSRDKRSKEGVRETETWHWPFDTDHTDPANIKAWSRERMVAWKLDGCSYATDKTTSLKEGLSNSEALQHEFLESCRPAFDAGDPPSWCLRGMWNELVTRFDPGPDSVLAFFCTEAENKTDFQHVREIARKEIQHARDLYREAFDKTLPLLVLRTRGIREFSRSPFAMDQEDAALQHFPQPVHQWQIWMALVVISAALGVTLARPCDFSLPRSAALPVVAGMYMLTNSWQGLSAELYKHFLPGTGRLHFSAIVIVMCSRALAWIFGLSYMYMSQGVAGLRASFDYESILRYATPSVLFGVYELFKMWCMSGASATWIQLVLLMSLGPLAVGRLLLFQANYSSGQWFSIVIMTIAGCGFSSSEKNIDNFSTTVLPACMCVFLNVAGCLCGEYLLVKDNDTPLVLQTNWMWPSEIAVLLLTAFASGDNTTLSMKALLDTFHAVNSLVWSMIFVMGVHCLWSSYTTKAYGSVVKSLAGVGSWVFPTYTSLAILHIEQPGKGARLMFGLICVLSAAFFIYQSTERSSETASTSPKQTKLPITADTEEQAGTVASMPDQSNRAKGDQLKGEPDGKRAPDENSTPIQGQPDMDRPPDADVTLTAGEVEKVPLVGLVLIFCIYACAVAYGIKLWAEGSELSAILPIATKTVVFTVAIRLLVWLVKWKWMTLLGFSCEEVQLYLGCTTYNLKMWCDKFGDGPLMRCDGMCRKIPHIFFHLSSLFGWSIITHRSHHGNPESLLFDLVVMTGLAIIDVCGSLWVDWWPLNWAIAGITRIRDGKLRRLNYTVVCVVSQSASIIQHYAAIKFLYDSGLYDDTDMNLILQLTFYPVAIGDAFAELVGVFGTWRFPVYGLGEINNKSVEGAAAFVVSTFAASSISLWLHGSGASWYVLAGLISFIGMLMETITPRGFDNATIPLSALGLAYGFAKLDLKGSL
eukprot:TRINITY_DN18238_c0_g1_i1.p1 TRINITY_DN18238_c0_g1~~TRINITY_DN18238_c0_g1_i1.p1  ORF type:complete len:1376 (-),score=170.69 TRINITY_DN18238_c0_g1_i1:289-4383(-)